MKSCYSIRGREGKRGSVRYKRHTTRNYKYFSRHGVKVKQLSYTPFPFRFFIPTSNLLPFSVTSVFALKLVKSSFFRSLQS